ncbi:O-antigen ligase family protein [Priestia megaterium]
MKNTYWLFFLFVGFISIQPIIDMLTTYMVLNMDSGLSIGVVIRFLYMIFAGVLLLVFAKQSKWARYSIIYLIVFALFLGLNIYLNHQWKDPYYIGQEIKFFNKVVYMNVTLLGMIVMFSHYRSSVDVKRILSKNLLTASLIISIVFIGTMLTGTALESYQYNKIGFKGWFYAANELGATIAILLPLTLLLALDKVRSFSKAYYWIPFILLAVSSIMLGTKVGLGAVILSLVVATVVLFAKLFTNKRSLIKANLVISILLLIVTGATTPISPAYKNTYTHIDMLEAKKEKTKQEKPEKKEKAKPAKKKKQKESNLDDKDIQNLILSSREQFLAHHKEEYAKAPIARKMIGMGFSGDYTKQLPPKMIEMDFYDLFFSLGIIGFLLWVLPLLLVGLTVLVRLFKDPSQLLDESFMMYSTAIVLALGIAFVAGHVFTAPAVTIYFAAAAAYLFVIHFKQRQA